jgi:enoyl-CoA hydratase
VNLHTGVFKFIRIEQIGNLARISLQRPPVNAVNQAMYSEIRELFGRIDEYLPEIGAVILEGAGRHFSAGNDLEEFLTLTPDNSPGRMKLVREAFAAIYDCPVPVVAAVQGYALGTGVALVGSCDLVICGESAHFGTPEISVGVMGGAKHLSRMVPQQVVRAMYLTADPMPAAEIMRFGGVTSIVPDDELSEAALRLAHRITRHSRSAIRMAKESLNTIEYMDLKSGYEFEQRLTSQLVGNADSKEARRALVEKRPPHFTQEGGSQDESASIPVDSAATI